MIIVNGYITKLIAAGGGINSTTGYAITTNVQEGMTIPCQWVISRMSLQSRVDGELVPRKSYAVYIEGEWDYETELVRLSTSDGTILLDNARIETIEPLTAVLQTRLII